jgi:hypothetical protein
MEFPTPPHSSLEGAFLFTGSHLSAFDQTDTGKTLTQRGTPIWKWTEFGVECTKLNDFVTNITEKLNYTVLVVGRQTQDLTPNESSLVLSCYDNDITTAPKGSQITIQGTVGNDQLRTTLLTNAQLNATPSQTQDVNSVMDVVTGITADRPRYRCIAMQIDATANRFKGWHSNGYNTADPLVWVFNNLQSGASRNLANRRLGGNWIIGGSSDADVAATGSAQVLYCAFYNVLLTEAELKAEYIALKTVLGLHGITI